VNDLEALTQAVIAAEADDLPRLVLADYLEERDEPERAAFIRAQCEIAAAKPWSTVAVYARHHRPDWLDGRDFRATLPQTSPRFVEWLASGPFHRGFGHALHIRDLTAFLDVADSLFEQAPIKELHLPTAPLSEWRRFAERPWLPRVQSVHFFGISTPIEPIRVLCDSPRTTGLREIVFERAGSPAMPDLIAGLVRSPLAKTLRSLQFHVASESVDELIGAFDSGPRRLNLDRLTFRVMNLNADLAGRILDRRLLESLSEFRVEFSPQLGNAGLRVFAKSPQLARLEVLQLPWNQITDAGAAVLASSPHLGNLKALDLSSNVLGPGGLRRLGRSKSLRGLRSLVVKNCRLWADSPKALTEANFWPNLVELDLSENRIADASALLAVPPPPNLAALVLRGNPLAEVEVKQLQEHFRGQVVFGG